ncbi:WD-40 repeat-containing protein [Cavenderia fasciculata]|uniref:Coronin n=1 Tax=Cavenderia fasciculata TaxID=261658 RepID=F4PJE3_CACFS|nr:WD-40 repeat-containing protein [Cavenderia fasciculata]EGG24429.1 WD-40 repeat-containing protein [Cavenderia fasciculata]|eukprot:XP_004362280.1 WD-40 repeat-containing protein [Cavenderia fasciculata]
MAFKLNVSKYRHTNGKVDKKELWYPDINTSGSSAASTFIKANTKYIAANWQAGTGTVGIIPLKQFGKRKGEVYTIHAHSNQLTDFEFSPFDQQLLATASEDATVKLWSLPSGLTEPATTRVTLSGHTKAIDSVVFNPVAANVLASGSLDKTVKIWDLESGQERITLDCFDNALTGIAWNYDGTLLATVSKDLKNRVIDVRSKTVVQQGDGHQGVKPARVVWLGNSKYFLTVGFSKMRERQLMVWDSRDVSKSVKSVTLDSSTGIINPVYDQDASLLFIAGTGDSTIRTFDMNTQFTEEPALQELSPVPTDSPAKGICAIPKLALDVMEVEIDRILKITANSIQPITYSMSRKSKTSFAEELFPNTSSQEPALQAQEWFDGETRVPNLVSLDPANRPQVQEDNYNQSTSNNSPYASATSPTTLSSQFDSKLVFADEAPILDSNYVAPDLSNQEPEPEVVSKRPEDNVARTGIVPKVVRTSKYRHIAGTAFPRSQQYTNLKVSGNTSNTCIASNSLYFAVPFVGTGGPLAVIPISQVGRQINNPCIELGAQLLDFDLSQFNPDLVVTGGEDLHIKVWRVPEGGLPKTGKHYTNFEIDLTGHFRRLTSVNFHPTVANALISTGGDFMVKLWDIEQQKEAFSFNDHHTDMITSIDVSRQGDLFLSSSKDKMMRVFDPRSNQLISETLTHTGSKGGKSLWLGTTGNMFSVGFNKSSEREYQLWDSRNLGQPISSGVFDHLAGVITPYYDEDTGVVYLAGKGDGSIRMMEVNDIEPYAHFLTEYSSGSPQMGVSRVSKNECNVRKCEISRFFKVSDSTVEQISINVPRNRMEFFQDDIYPETRSKAPAMTAQEYFSGGLAREPTMVSLCPSDMTPLSQAPAIVKKEREIIKEEVVDDSPSRDQVIHGFLDRVQAQNRGGIVKKAKSEAVPLFVEDEPAVADDECGFDDPEDVLARWGAVLSSTNKKLLEIARSISSEEFETHQSILNFIK